MWTPPHPPMVEGRGRGANWIIPDLCEIFSSIQSGGTKDGTQRRVCIESRGRGHEDFRSLLCSTGFNMIS